MPKGSDRLSVMEMEAEVKVGERHFDAGTHVFFEEGGNQAVVENGGRLDLVGREQLQALLDSGKHTRPVRVTDSQEMAAVAQQAYLELERSGRHKRPSPRTATAGIGAVSLTLLLAVLALLRPGEKSNDRQSPTPSNPVPVAGDGTSSMNPKTMAAARSPEVISALTPEERKAMETAWKGVMEAVETGDRQQLVEQVDALCVAANGRRVPLGKIDDVVAMARAMERREIPAPTFESYHWPQSKNPEGVIALRYDGQRVFATVNGGKEFEIPLQLVEQVGGSHRANAMVGEKVVDSLDIYTEPEIVADRQLMGQLTTDLQGQLRGTRNELNERTGSRRFVLR